MNHPRDIQSLLAFLEVQPLADKATFEGAITQPIEQLLAVGLTRLRAATSCFALRRTKDVLEKAIKLPPKTVTMLAVPFEEDSIHKTVHDVIYEVARMVLVELFESDQEERIAQSFKFLMVLLLRVRQSCCHASLVPIECRDRARELYDDLQANGGILDPDEAVSVLGRLVGGTKEEQVSSPSSRSVASSSSMDMSPKIAALLNYIDIDMKSDEKMIIFSQWTSHLNLISTALSEAGHQTCRIDGSMNAEERLDSISKFESPGCTSKEEPRFVLCSLMACGTGINLTRGNHVCLLDVWWNEAAESQAMDRCHRIGQKRPVSVVRFVIENSIEERMITLQQSKAALGKGTLEKLTRKEQQKARLTAVRDLFQIDDTATQADWDFIVDDDDDDDDDFILD